MYLMMCTELVSAIRDIESQFGSSALESSQIQEASSERQRLELIGLQQQVHTSERKSSMEVCLNDSSRNHTVSLTCEQSQVVPDSSPSSKENERQEVACLEHSSNLVQINVSEEAASVETLQKQVEKLRKELETAKQEAKVKGKTARHLQKKVSLYELASSARANKVRKPVAHLSIAVHVLHSWYRWRWPCAKCLTEALYFSPLIELHHCTIKCLNLSLSS